MVNLNSPASDIDDTGASRSPGTALYTVVALALIVAMAGLGLAYGFKAWFDATEAGHAGPALTEIHAVSIGAQRYAVPASLIADPAQRRDGFAERIDLMLALPLGPDGRLSEIDITIMPRGRVRTSAALLDSVYLHQFSGTHLSGPSGLVGKPLERDAGTQGETIWYDPLSANPFIAKCMVPVDASAVGRTCLRVMALSDRNTAIVSFDPALLANWRNFDPGIDAALGELRL